MNTPDFQKVIKAADIREIFMTSTNCKCHIHYALVNPKHTMLNVKKRKVKTDFVISQKEKKGTIFSEVDFAIEGISQKDIKIHKQTISKKNDPVFTISASYMAVYDVNNINLNKDAVRYFGEENALFNIHPYLREFITHISQRLNLHPVLIPLLKPQNQPVKPVKENKTKTLASNKKHNKKKT